MVIFPSVLCTGDLYIVVGVSRRVAVEGTAWSSGLFEQPAPPMPAAEPLAVVADTRGRDEFDWRNMAHEGFCESAAESSLSRSVTSETEMARSSVSCLKDSTLCVVDALLDEVERGASVVKGP